MSITKEQAMVMFDSDLENFMNEVRALMAYYRIGDWEAYLLFRKRGCAGSYALKYEASAGDAFAESLVSLHLTEAEGERDS